jgi:hypothetical protein
MVEHPSSTGTWRAVSGSTLAPPLPGIGSHRGPDLIHAVLDRAGVRAPHTGAAFSAAMLAGLGGAIGFRYAIRLDPGLGPLPTVDAEHGRDPFIQSALHRARVPYSVRQTGSVEVARRNLLGVLAERRTAVCTVLRAGLPWHRLGDGLDGPEGYELAVLGLGSDPASPSADGVAAGPGTGSCVIDEGLPVRGALSLTEFVLAWSAGSPGRHQLLTVTGTRPVSLDLAAAIREAVNQTIGRLRDPRDPDQSASATEAEQAAPERREARAATEWTGLVAMRELGDQLADPAGPAGWAARFSEAEHFFRALTRLHDGVQSAYGVQAAMRTLYADFLAEAAPLLGPDQDRFQHAAELYRGAGATWAQVAATALPEDVPALRRYGELAALRRSLMRGQGQRAGRRLRGIAREMAGLPRAYAAAEPLTGVRLRDLLDGLADLVRECAALEDDAIRVLHEKSH